MFGVNIPSLERSALCSSDDMAEDEWISRRRRSAASPADSFLGEDLGS
jgi:hypothetical protein